MVEATMVEGDELRTGGIDYPVTVRVEPQMENRNRLTAFFRVFLALPHIILVGAPIALATSVSWSTDNDMGWGWGSGGGVLSAVAGMGALIAWLFIVLAGRHPDGLWRLGAWYMRWRVRAAAYITLLRDDYPPFGDSAYPASVDVARPTGPRDRLTVFFRIFLALPHIFLLWMLGVAWAVTTAVAWVVILFTGRYPETLYGFALGVLAWTARVECYLLLLRDEYPPFTLRV